MIMYSQALRVAWYKKEYLDNATIWVRDLLKLLVYVYIRNLCHLKYRNNLSTIKQLAIAVGNHRYTGWTDF